MHHTAMKRSYEDSDFEEDEGYNQEKCLDGEEDETKARKKRRGLIEKKRRDRINSCLTELRRLVPAAIDKQSSAKLEKAEILQLTVEHLRNLRTIAKHEAVLKSTDFRAVGFRECLNEVTSYLYNYQDKKEEHKAGQLLNHLTTVMPTRQSGYLCQSSTTVWPALPGGRLGEHQEIDCNHERTLFPVNPYKQQNHTLNTDRTATPSRGLHGMSMMTENHNPKPLHFTLFPVYNDNSMQFVGFPFTPR